MFSAANGTKLCGFSLHSSCFVITKANSFDCHGKRVKQKVEGNENP